MLGDGRAPIAPIVSFPAAPRPALPRRWQAQRPRRRGGRGERQHHEQSHEQGHEQDGDPGSVSQRERKQAQAHDQTGTPRRGRDPIGKATAARSRDAQAAAAAPR